MRVWAFLLVETSLLLGSFLAAVRLRFGAGAALLGGYPRLPEKTVLHVVALLLCFYYADLYQASSLRKRFEPLVRLAQAFLLGTVILALVYLVLPSLTAGRGVLSLFLPLAFASVLGWRYAYLWIAHREMLSDSVLVLGTGASAVQIVRETMEHSPVGYRVVGFVGEHRAEVGRRLFNPTVLGTIEDLPHLVERHRVSLIVVALDDRRGRMPVAELLRCRLMGIRVEEAPSFFERLTGKILVRNLRPSWLVFSQGFRKPRLFLRLKQSAEFVVALAALVVSGPLLALVALLVKLDSRGPVFYRQERVGEGGRTIALMKFRTMRADAEAATGPVWAAAEGDPRMTRLGRYLRKTRLDELPQLINVLRGEMSFVGPRPERPHFVETLRRVIPYYDERHSVKPGITGWAQIKFGYGATIEDAEEKLQYDLYYIKHMSPWFDVGVVLQTLKVMLLGRGAR
jgi:sugar transferase (PEP-CTERM system associated)